eukprot:3316847-Amphidinium_carterae.1
MVSETSSSCLEVHPVCIESLHVAGFFSHALREDPIPCTMRQSNFHANTMKWVTYIPTVGPNDVNNNNNNNNQNITIVLKSTSQSLNEEL